MRQKITMENDGTILVIDSFLDSSNWLSLWEYFQAETFTKIHQEQVVRVYRHFDGEGMCGRPFVIGPQEAEMNEPSDLIPAVDEAVPAPIASLMKAMLRNEAVTEFFRDCTDWSHILLRCFIYPPGTGVGWHKDANKAAAFIYYAHPSWHPSWGGELMFSARSEKPADQAGGGDRMSFRSWYEKFDDAALAQSGLGGFCLPMPNRLVLIKGGAPHAIKKVEVAAGDAFRASVAGFFAPDPE